jgi:hypothetical protein
LQKRIFDKDQQSEKPGRIFAFFAVLPFGLVSCGFPLFSLIPHSPVVAPMPVAIPVAVAAAVTVCDEPRGG